MASSVFFRKSIELPTILTTPNAPSIDPAAWLGGDRLTVRMRDDFMALCVHTNDKACPEEAIFYTSKNSLEFARDSCSSCRIFQESHCPIRPVAM
jgi:hypothetical protein